MYFGCGTAGGLEPFHSVLSHRHLVILYITLSTRLEIRMFTYDVFNMTSVLFKQISLQENFAVFKEIALGMKRQKVRRIIIDSGKKEAVSYTHLSLSFPIPSDLSLAQIVKLNL